MEFRCNKKTGMPLLIACITILAVVLPTAAGAANSRSKAPMGDFETGETIGGTHSVLYRNASGVAMRISSKGLPKGTYTNWWVIWNDPSKCATSPCGEADLFIEGNEIGFATGQILSKSKQRYVVAAGLDAGDLTNMLLGVGLTNPEGAEIHLVVQWHGPILPAAVNKQIQSPPGGTCHPSTGCPDLQFSIHTP